MGQLGGAKLGAAGIEDPRPGSGIEANPDGEVAGFELDFTSGLQGDVYFMNSVTAMALTDDVGSNSHSIPYTDPGNNERDGFYNDADIYDGGDADVRMTFEWTGDAATDSQLFGIAIFDPSTADLPPGMSLLSQRNAPILLQPRNYDNTIPVPVMTNAGAAHTLTGSELTLDVPHTMGFSISGISVTFFFDGAIIDGPFDMDAGEQANVAGCTRLGYLYLTSGTTSKVLSRLFSMEIRPLGDIY